MPTGIKIERNYGEVLDPPLKSVSVCNLIIFEPGAAAYGQIKITLKGDGVEDEQGIGELGFTVEEVEEVIVAAQEAITRQRYIAAGGV